MKLEDEIMQKKFRNEYHKAFVNIIYTHNRLAEIQNKALKPYNITPQQFNILRILRGQYPASTSIKTLRERMLDKMSDASRIVEKLRSKNLVSRVESKDDRRKVDVTISEKGLALLKKLDKVINHLDNCLSNLNETEIKEINRLLDKIRG